LTERMSQASEDILAERYEKLRELFPEVFIAGREVYAMAGRELFVCLEDVVDEELLRGIVDLGLVRVVCLDSAFHGNDKLKTNAVLEMKDRGVEFRTV
jgi:adenine-specific DNA-methyltransferase